MVFIRNNIRDILTGNLRSLFGDASGGGVTPPSPPSFDYDENTYWYNFKANNNTYDDFAFDSLAYAPNQNIEAYNRFFEQPVKDYQPFYTDGVGITFGNTSGRFMTLYPLPDFNQDKDGTFFACNIFTSGTGTLLILNSFEIAGGRGKFIYTSSRKLEIRMGAGGADNGTLTLIKTSTDALVIDTWYTVGFLIDRTNDIVKIYVNGVEVDTSTTSSPYANTGDFPLKSAILGADGVEGATGATFDGIISDMIFQDSLQLGFIESQLDYLQEIKLDIPDAPVISVATANGGVVVSFSQPNPHNSPITDYNYQYKLASSGTWLDFSDGTSGTAGTTITGLTNDSLYDFRARAINAVGTGAWSSPAQGTPTANPGPPNAPVISVVPTNSQVAINYTQPGTNGYPITAYKNYYKESSSGTWILFNTTTTPSTTVTGLTNGVAYDFSVIATNSQGDSPRSNTESGTPGITNNMQNIVASCVGDWDLRFSACYSGSGTTVSNLVTAPADGALQTDYDIQLGDGSTSSTYPTFGGTAGTESAKLTFDGGDFLTLVSSTNPPTFKNAHKNSGGSALTIMVFFESLPNLASGSPTIFSTRDATTDVGLTGYLNTSEFCRADQRGNTNTVNYAPSMTGCPTGTSAWIAFAFSENSTSEGGTRQTFWNSALGSGSPVTTNTSYNATTTDASQKMNFFRRGAGTPNIMPNGMILKSIYAFNERFDNAKVASVVAEASARHGVTYPS